MASLKEQLETLGPEGRAQLKAEVIRRQAESGGGGVSGVISGGLRGAARGISSAIQGKPFAALQQTPASIESLKRAGGLRDFEEKEKIKSRLRREEIEALTGGQDGVQGAASGDFREESVTIGGRKFKRRKTEEEFEQEIEREANAKARIKEKSELASTKSKLGVGKLVSASNLETLAGVTFDLSTLYSKGVEEGGIGGAIQAGLSGAAEKIGDLPGGFEVGGRFPESGAFVGKRNEQILKMSPMLTQQSTKSEGSVRLIESVLRVIGRTIPDKSTAPKQARRQLEETLKSFFRFARAAELLGSEFDRTFGKDNIDEISDAEMAGWARRIQNASERVEIKGSELKAMESLINTALKPIDDLIKRGGVGAQTPDVISPGGGQSGVTPGGNTFEIIR